ncbi:MAG: YtxH domain-containing protein [Elusimicrobia bacterium]|nr:YtxH domain-containing protein [Elusimicrobiota bacterium]
MEAVEQKKRWPFLLVGVAVGAVAGLLFARKPGKELRSDIKTWVKKNRQKSREVLANLKERIPAKKEQFMAAIRAGREALKGRNHHHKELVHS